LENKDLEQAIEFASAFSHLDFFTHILELLLHDTLENEADNAPPEGGSLPTSPFSPSLSTQC